MCLPSIDNIDKKAVKQSHYNPNNEIIYTQKKRFTLEIFGLIYIVNFFNT
jgi:hypothetical protein